MSLTKRVVVDRVEVVNGNVVQVRERTEIVEGDEVISISYHRKTFAKGADYADETDLVRGVCQLVLT